MSTPTDFRASAVLTGRKRWAALMFLALGVAMIILDATVVNVAIPTMVKDLDLTTSDAEWVSAAYSLTFASLLILSGRVADRAGRRPVLLAGLMLYTAASIGAMLAGSPGEAAELRRRVTSPGGTTQAAMAIMEDGRFRELVFKAAEAARDRSKALALK